MANASANFTIYLPIVSTVCRSAANNLFATFPTSQTPGQICRAHIKQLLQICCSVWQANRQIGILKWSVSRNFKALKIYIAINRS